MSLHRVEAHSCGDDTAALTTIKKVMTSPVAPAYYLIAYSRETMPVWLTL